MFAQRLCVFALTRFWQPVGIGVGGPEALDALVSYLSGGPRGQREAQNFDVMMRTLPGMDPWRDLGQRWFRDSCAHHRRADPGSYALHRACDRRRDADAEGIAPA